MIREQRLDPVVHYLDYEQALTIVELLRPKTVVQAPRTWVTPLSLPRIEPPATA